MKSKKNNSSDKSDKNRRDKKRTKKINAESQESETELLKNQLARALADYDNLTKRIERERDTFGLLANARLVKQLLPVLDMLYEANSHLNDRGLAIAIQNFEETLREAGFIKLETKAGDMFDENIMEAVEVEQDKKKNDGEITEVLLRGWSLTDNSVIRPVKVKVNKRN